jgi:hypothetical protein
MLLAGKQNAFLSATICWKLTLIEVTNDYYVGKRKKKIYIFI